MAKKLNLLFLSLLISAFAFSQSAGTVVSGNAFAYKAEHHLFQKGNKLTLVSLNLEWPRVIDYSKAEPLQRYLTSFLFGEETLSLDDAWERLSAECGKEISAMPEHGAKDIEYKDIQLKVLDNRHGKYISLYAYVQERDSTAIRSTHSHYFTFDLINNKVLGQDDVFIKSKVWYNTEWRYVFEEAVQQTLVVDPMETGELWLDSVPNQFYLKNAAAYLMVKGSPGRNSYSVLGLDVLAPLLTKRFKKWLAISPEIHVDATLTSSDLFGKETNVELSPDTLASFPGGRNAFIVYLSKNIDYSPPEGEQMGGRVTVSFVVDENGAPSEFIVLTPINPGVNRCLIDALRLMPKWNAATKGGKKVRSRVTYPISLS